MQTGPIAASYWVLCFKLPRIFVHLDWRSSLMFCCFHLRVVDLIPERPPRVSFHTDLFSSSPFCINKTNFGFLLVFRTEVRIPPHCPRQRRCNSRAFSLLPAVCSVITQGIDERKAMPGFEVPRYIGNCTYSVVDPPLLRIRHSSDQLMHQAEEGVRLFLWQRSWRGYILIPHSQKGKIQYCSLCISYVHFCC